MKQFEVYKHPTFGFEAVKKGFSWPGFFFTWLWMLSCRMWIGVIVVIAFSGMGFLMLVAMVGMGTGSLASWLVPALIIGAKGNAWRRAKLTKRGFRHVKSIQARNRNTAIAEGSGTEEATAVASSHAIRIPDRHEPTKHAEAAGASDTGSSP